MNLTRRGLLKALPALPVAGNEIKRHAAKLAGVSLGDQYGNAIGGQGVPCADAGMSPGLRGNALVRFLRGLGGLPKWKLREIRNQARQNRQIDPDIASLRSVSLVGAMNMQWNRNEKRMTRDVLGWLEYDIERDDWLKKNGVDWL